MSIHKYQCAECEKMFGLKRKHSNPTRAFCSRKCAGIANMRHRRRPATDYECSVCGATFTSDKKKRATVQRVCSKRCAGLARSAEGIARNARHSSERMYRKNPMSRPEVREKVSRTHKARGHKPVIQGGNGRGMTRHERRIAKMLNWKPIIVKTLAWATGAKMPNHYKIDVGNHALKIAIEIDGSSHNTLKRQSQDRKKDRFLRSQGWSVLRFTNRRVDEEPEECLKAIVSTILKSKATTITSQTGS